MTLLESFITVSAILVALYLLLVGYVMLAFSDTWPGTTGGALILGVWLVGFTWFVSNYVITG